ncbi:hypothetical protein [Streptomyces sp. NPDC026092]|uniref:hypothetical protein n=1 Tax=Streptomyces sp. NPDC026092 TaxID=3154797 RepID=UPI0033CC69C4
MLPTRIRHRLVGGAVVAAAATAAIVPTMSAVHAADTAEAPCQGFTAEVTEPTGTGYYVSGSVKVTNTSDKAGPFTLKLTLPEGTTFDNHRSDVVGAEQHGGHVTLTPVAAVPAHGTVDFGFGISSAVDNPHLHLMGSELNGAALDTCTGTGGDGASDGALTASVRSKKDQVDLWFADLAIPADGAHRYEIFLNGKLATTAVFGSNFKPVNGTYKQVLPLGPEAGVTYKVKVRPVEHHAGAFSDEISITTGK